LQRRTTSNPVLAHTFTSKNILAVGWCGRPPPAAGKFKARTERLTYLLFASYSGRRRARTRSSGSLRDAALMGPAALCTLPSRRTSSGGNNRALSLPGRKVARLFYELGCFAAISLRQFSLSVSFDTRRAARQRKTNLLCVKVEHLLYEREVGMRLRSTPDISNPQNF
jgi:hypothetical protein